MKIGIIGLGDIPQKLYLPVLTEKEDIELILWTRNINNLKNCLKSIELSNMFKR